MSWRAENDSLGLNQAVNHSISMLFWNESYCKWFRTKTERKSLHTISTWKCLSLWVAVTFLRSSPHTSSVYLRQRAERVLNIWIISANYNILIKYLLSSPPISPWQFLLPRPPQCPTSNSRFVLIHDDCFMIRFSHISKKEMHFLSMQIFLFLNKWIVFKYAKAY